MGETIQGGMVVVVKVMNVGAPAELVEMRHLACPIEAEEMMHLRTEETAYLRDVVAWLGEAKVDLVMLL